MSDRSVRRLLLRRVLPLGAVVVLVGGSALAARAATASDPGAQYRTATVTRGDVEQELDLTGAVSPVQQVSVGFPAAGTVQTVAVGIGDTVTAGQVLATLDPSPLQSAVTQAVAGLASAQAQLETATDATDTSSTSTSASTAGTASTASTAARTTGSTGPTAGKVDLSAPQRAVQQAQSVVDSTLATAQAAVAAEQKACAPTSTATPTPTDSASPTPRPGASTAAPAGGRLPTPAPSPGGSKRATCTTAVTDVLAAQQQVATAQAALSTAQTALSAALTHAAATTGSTGTTTGTTGSSRTSGSTGSTAGSSTGGSSTAGGSGSASGGSSGGAAGTPASRVDTAQVSVLQARATLDAARTALAGATLTAPVGGTVAALPFTVGAQATTSQSVTLVGSGAVRVTVDVPLAQLPKVAVGQAARVTPLGATTAVDGSVEQISLLPASATTSTPTYAVQVLVPQPPAALASGASAAVAIVLGTAKDVLLVPASAVTRLPTGTASVLVLSGGVEKRTQVTLGTVGQTRAEVVSGLAAGDKVVLADLSQALPTSSTATTARFAGGGAGFGGAAGGGGFGAGAGAPPGAGAGARPGG